MGQLSGRRTGAFITRWYQHDRGPPHVLPVGQVRSVAVRSGTTVEVPLTMVRTSMRNGSRATREALHMRAKGRSQAGTTPERA